MEFLRLGIIEGIRVISYHGHRCGQYDAHKRVRDGGEDGAKLGDHLIFGISIKNFPIEFTPKAIMVNPPKIIVTREATRVMPTTSKGIFM